MRFLSKLVVIALGNRHRSPLHKIRPVGINCINTASEKRGAGRFLWAGLLALFFLLFGTVLTSPSVALAADVVTDRPDYAPGDTVWIMGSGFFFGEPVSVQITHVDEEVTGGEGHDAWTVQASSSGEFITHWEVPYDDNVGESLKVTATGQVSGLVATFLFTDRNAKLTITTIFPNQLCPGSSVQVCAQLLQKCPGHVRAPLEGRQILFFISPGLGGDDCEANTGQDASDSVFTDASGNACANLTMPATPGNYTIRVEFRGEPKPNPCPNLGNSGCSPNDPISNKRCVHFSSSKDCQPIEVVAACGPSQCVCVLGYPDNSNPPRSQVVFNESDVLRAFSPDASSCATNGGTIKLWYSDEHALLLGVRRVVVKNSTGAIISTTDYPVTSLLANPGSVFNPAVGTTAVDGDQAGTDVSSCAGFPDLCDRPIWPALFITDITSDPASRAGDWQFGGTGIPAHAVFGTWKAAVRTVTPTSVSITPDANPAKNNWNLGPGSDVPPGGFGSLVDEGYGAECRWNIDDLGLLPGHTYRLQFMVHDGDQNKPGGDVGVGCTTAKISPSFSITCPSPAPVCNTTGQCNAVVDYPAPTVTGGTPPYSTACTPPSGSTFPVGTTLVTCTATDAAGETAPCTFNLTVNDCQKPAIAPLGNITLNAAPGQCEIAVTYNASASDNCPGVNLDITPPYDSRIGGAIFHVGVTTVKLVATDAAGNKDSSQFTVTVNDTEKPMISCRDIVKGNDPGHCDTTVIYNNSVLVSDNCPGVTYVCSPPSGSRFPVGVTTVICEATDASGNKESCQFTVTVLDVQKPTIYCSDIVTGNDFGTCEARVEYPDSALNSCPGVTVVCTPPSGSNFLVGNSTVKCVATDASGNQDSCQFTVTVNDTEKPSVSCPANITTDNTPGRCDARVDYPPPTTADNCPGPVTVDCNPPSGSIFPKGVTPVTCAATDASGNQESCQFSVTVNDTEKPSISCPADITTDNTPGRCDALVDYPPPTTGDNCSGVTYVCSPPSGSIFPLGSTTVTCTATDASGNEASCQFVVTVLPASAGCETPCLELQIAKIENGFLGQNFDVSIDNPRQFTDPSTRPNPSGIGGFSFLISYDCACLQFLSARKGAMLEQDGWEYFTFRYGAIGNSNCGSGCPSCLIRIVAIADVNNGALHPNLSRSNLGQWAVMRFRVSDDRSLSGQFCPVNWFWFDCTDNTVSDSTGNTLWVVDSLFTIDGNPINLVTSFPNNVSNCDQFSGGPDRPSPKKRTCFRNGGIQIPSSQPTVQAVRGDINQNGLAYEPGDIVLYENYFIYGAGVFATDPVLRQTQIAASDVNNDGLSLSVADLVTTIRVLNRDIAPLPKLSPGAAAVTLSWTASADELKITASSTAELGGLFARFRYSGTAEKEVRLLTPAEGMLPKVNNESGELRVIIDPGQRGARLPAGDFCFAIPLKGKVEFVEAQASNYQGQSLPVVTKVAATPAQFALSQNYPNPFNPKTNFVLSMPVAGAYKITIYNLLGEAVRTFEGQAPAGRQVFTWDGTDRRGRTVSSGIYFYKAEFGAYEVTKKMMLMR